MAAAALPPQPPLTVHLTYLLCLRIVSDLSFYLIDLSHSNRINVRKFLEWMGSVLNFKTMRDWYAANTRDFNRLGGGTVMRRHHSIPNVVMRAYPIISPISHHLSLITYILSLISSEISYISYFCFLLYYFCFLLHYFCFCFH